MEWRITETGEVQLSRGSIHDGRKNKELCTRMGKGRALMRALQYSVVIKQELLRKAKLSIFKTVFVPILTYGYESWVMTGKNAIARVSVRNEIFTKN